MIKEYFQVYRGRTTDTSGDFDPIKRFCDPERAINLARKIAETENLPTYVEWQQVEITRDGAEILDSDASYHGFGPSA